MQETDTLRRWQVSGAGYSYCLRHDTRIQVPDDHVGKGPEEEDGGAQGPPDTGYRYLMIMLERDQRRRMVEPRVLLIQDTGTWWACWRGTRGGGWWSLGSSWYRIQVPDEHVGEGPEKEDGGAQGPPAPPARHYQHLGAYPRTDSYTECTVYCTVCAMCYLSMASA